MTVVHGDDVELLKRLRGLRYGARVSAVGGTGEVRRVDEHSLTVVVRVGNVEKPLHISEVQEI